MNFPGGERIRRIKRVLFPSEADLRAERDAALAAMPAKDEVERVARKTEADEVRRGCANRLRPYIGRLVLVTNFQGGWPEESADRVRDAVLATGIFGADTPIGVSVVLSEGRGNHETLLETADTLLTSFRTSIGDRAFSAGSQEERSELWLLALARAAEDTVWRANLPPEKLGFIAAVSALDMNRQVNTLGTPAQGSAFKLAGISEDARFSWETVSLPPDRW